MLVEFKCEVECPTGPQVLSVEASVVGKKAFLDPHCAFAPDAIMLSMADSLGRQVPLAELSRKDVRLLKQEAFAAARKSPFLTRLLEEGPGDASDR